MLQQSSASLDNPEDHDNSDPEHLGSSPDYRYVEDFRATGRLRDPETGRFIATCPFYPKHPAPCPDPIWTHYGCLWPDHLSPEEAARFFAATERPWSDSKARKIVFGAVGGIRFDGQPS